MLQNYFEPTQFFFLGLIIGIIPFIIKGADVKRNFAFRHWFVLIAAAILLALTGFMNPNKAVEPITSLNTLSILGLFLAGWLASMAMLLPGISGSFVLLLLGVYSTGIYALSTFNIPLIVTIGSGVIVGFAVSSKGIRYAITRFPYMTFAIIIGMLMGSVFPIFPGIATDSATIVMSVITFGLGLGITIFIGSRKTIIK